MKSIICRRLIFLLSSLPFILSSILLFPNISSSVPVADEYMPDCWYDGFEAITDVQNTNWIQGQGTQTESYTEYSWISGNEFIFGTDCWKMCYSRLGFYQNYNVNIISLCTFDLRNDNELRYYGSDTTSSNGTRNTYRPTPYEIAWKYGKSLGDQYSYNYTWNTASCSFEVSTTITLLSYEAVSSPFAYYPNCLKWERYTRTTSHCNGQTSTSYSTVTFWNALNKGVVKSFGQGSGYESTTYFDQEVVSTPPAQNGKLQVILTPSEAVTAGAQWNVDGGAWQNSGVTVSGLGAGSHTVNYKTVTGWTAPGSESVTISGGQTTQITRNYLALDSDGDGLPDWWESRYGLNPYINDANQDSDSDGFTNLVEYQKSTNPSDPNSHPYRTMPWIPLLLGE